MQEGVKISTFFIISVVKKTDMKNKFFVYASNIKNLPKGLITFIVIVLLILIPLILSIAFIAMAAALIYFVARLLLPSNPKKEKPIDQNRKTISIDENGNIIK